MRASVGHGAPAQVLHEVLQLGAGQRIVGFDGVPADGFGNGVFAQPQGVHFRPGGFEFVHEFQDKLLFGTDVCFGDAEGRMPHLGFLRRLLTEGRISKDVFDKIGAGNALRILRRYRA